MAAKVHHHLDKTALHAMLVSPTGGVAKDLFRRGKKVEARAKLNLQRHPKRVNTGLLRSSINTQLIALGGKPAVRVGTNVFYAVFVHDGTGIYGPKGTYIYPKTAKVLAWKGKGGKKMYAYRVKGMEPNHFLADAMSAAKG